jgi:hypothetical protein
MSRKTPIWNDVVVGIGGKFTDSSDTRKLHYNFAILQENGMPILQEEGKYIYQDDPANE